MENNKQKDTGHRTQNSTDNKQYLCIQCITQYIIRLSLCVCGRFGKKSIVTTTMVNLN